MKKFTQYGIMGKLVQLQREGSAITFPRYVTAVGDEADRTMAYVTKINPHKGTIEVLVKKPGNAYKYRTMRVDRLRRTELIIRGRRRRRYFVANRNFGPKAELF